MSRTESTMEPLGLMAPDFRLHDVITGTNLSLAEIVNAKSAKRLGLLVMFVCVHCPYVKHVEAELTRIGRDYYGPAGDGPIAIAAIQSNDIDQYPEDALGPMREQALRLDWTFPYLLDSTQEVAHAYHAACTPDFFLFDSGLRLVYRGQLDDSRPRRNGFGNDEPVTGRDLRAAIEDVIAGRQPGAEQRPSIGCNIKWKTP